MRPPGRRRGFVRLKDAMIGLKVQARDKVGNGRAAKGIWYAATIVKIEKSDMTIKWARFPTKGEVYSTRSKSSFRYERRLCEAGVQAVGSQTQPLGKH